MDHITESLVANRFRARPLAVGAERVPHDGAVICAAYEIFVANSPGRGRGVFARQAFRADELIEVCPVIVLAPPETALIDATQLYSYYFGWKGERAAIALGFGSLYNHSPTPNAVYAKDYEAGVIRVRAVSGIAPGEEILIRYNTGKPGAAEPLWFDVR